MTSFSFLIDGVMITVVILKNERKGSCKYYFNNQKSRNLRNQNSRLFLFIVKAYNIYMSKKSQILKLLPKSICLKNLQRLIFT